VKRKWLCGISKTKVTGGAIKLVKSSAKTILDPCVSKGITVTRPQFPFSSPTAFGFRPRLAGVTARPSWRLTASRKAHTENEKGKYGRVTVNLGRAARTGRARQSHAASGGRVAPRGAPRRLTRAPGPGRRPTRPFGDRPGRSRPRRSPNGLAGHKPRRRRAVTPRRSLAIAGKERSAAEQRPLGLGRWRGNRPDLTARRRRGLAATGRRSERPSPDQPRLKEGAQSTG